MGSLGFFRDLKDSIPAKTVPSCSTRQGPFGPEGLLTLASSMKHKTKWLPEGLGYGLPSDADFHDPSKSMYRSSPIPTAKLFITSQVALI